MTASTRSRSSSFLAMILLIASGLAIAASLVTRPPADPPAAARRLALGLALMFALSPATRFGYFAYPLGLYGWIALCRIPAASVDGVDECDGPHSQQPEAARGWAGGAGARRRAGCRRGRAASRTRWRGRRGPAPRPGRWPGRRRGGSAAGARGARLAGARAGRPLAGRRTLPRRPRPGRPPGHPAGAQGSWL